MQNHYTARQVCLMQRLRQLWEQHVYWTRFFHHQHGGRSG